MKPSCLLVGCLAGVLVAANAASAAAQDHTRVKKPATPGEQAPPADPGQRNFGGPVGARGGGRGQKPAAPAPRPAVPVSTVSLDDLSMSDPFIFADQKTRTYYLTGTGGRL